MLMKQWLGALTRALVKRGGELQPMPEKKDDEATATWDERYAAGGTAVTEVGNVGDPIDYTSHPFLWRESIARRLTGRLDGNPSLEFAQRHFTPPKRRMLALGSGLASMEEWFVKCGFVESCVAFEASQVAVDKARERIAEAGLSDRLEMRSGDVLQASLPDASFDVVLVQAAIHHFFQIEDMFLLMHRVLKPGGLLVFDEYVGPDHLLFDDKTLDLMDEIDMCLAPEYRHSVQTNSVRQGVSRPTLQNMLDMDPSEGVHASQILPLTYQYFDVVDRADYGGTVMRPFFTGILGNFDFRNASDQTIGRLIVLIEDLLLRYGAIPHAHTRLAAIRRDVPLGPLSREQAERIGYSDWPGLTT
jgi:ubiquinone/menaquinone biosynthesis C-methylase UbiE